MELQIVTHSLTTFLIHHWLAPYNTAGVSKKSNIKPEALWSQLHCQFTPSFEDILDFRVNNGLYEANNPLKKHYCLTVMIF